MQARYRSALDPVMALLLFGIPIALLGYSLYLLVTSPDPSGGWIGLFIGLFVLGMVALMTLPCGYVIGEKALSIRCGPYREEIPLEKIRSVEPSWNLLSAPALSLRRVRITLDRGYRLISPVNREQFIEALRAKIG